MDAIQTAREAMHAASATKDQAVAREGVGTDLCPMVGLLRDGVRLGYVLLTGERLESLLAIEAVTALSACDAVEHVADSYEYSVPEDERPMAEEDMPPSLAALFAAGDPRVTESLTVSVSTVDKLNTLAVRSYAYEGREVVWGPVRLYGSRDEPERYIDGAITDAIQRGYGYQSRTKPMSLGELGAALGLTVAEYRLVSPPRNEPCPCGSGVKAKRCCWK